MSVLFTNEMAQKILDAINTLNSNLVNAKGGALSNLSTSTKTSIIAAINELVTGQGSLSSLSTTVKSSLVNAVNELLNQRGGALSNLSTNSKISIIAAINELVSGQGTLSSLSTSAKNNLVAAINELVNAYATINGKLDKLYVNNAGAHNSFCRRKKLGTSITPEQIAAIRNGSYDDLYIGDHWDFTVNSHWYELTIANFGSLFKVSESDIWASKNLVTVLVRSNALNYVPINDTADCEGHLANSKLQTVTFPAVLEEIETVIPSEHIVTIYESLADSIDDTGSVNHRTKTGCRMFLPSPHNMGLPYSPSWEKHDAYEYVSKIRWPLSVYVPNPGGYLAFSMNYDKTRWLSKVHPGLEYTTFPANSKAFEIQAYFFLG